MVSLLERVKSHPVGNLKKAIGKMAREHGFKGYSTMTRAEVEKVILDNPKLFTEFILPLNDEPFRGRSKNINKKEKKQLIKHATKHKGGLTGKHMKNMIKEMNKGAGFDEAHEKAVKKDKKIKITGKNKVKDRKIKITGNDKVKLGESINFLEDDFGEEKVRKAIRNPIYGSMEGRNQVRKIKLKGKKTKEQREIEKFEKDLAEELKDPSKRAELFGDLPKKKKTIKLKKKPKEVKRVLRVIKKPKLGQPVAALPPPVSQEPRKIKIKKAKAKVVNEEPEQLANPDPNKKPDLFEEVKPPAKPKKEKLKITGKKKKEAPKKKDSVKELADELEPKVNYYINSYFKLQLELEKKLKEKKITENEFDNAMLKEEDKVNSQLEEELIYSNIPNVFERVRAQLMERGTRKVTPMNFKAEFLRRFRRYNQLVDYYENERKGSKN